MLNNSPKLWDVFVVGGGPAGLATAIAARRRGLSVIVADGSIPPIDKSCGEGLMPDGVAALRSLGVSIPEADARPFRGIRFLSRGVKAEAQFPDGMAYGIRRTRLHQIMAEHAESSGALLLWQTAVRGLHPEGVQVAGTLVRARWVVGADGSASLVRGWAGLERNIPRDNIRFGFRRHYQIAPWTDFMELHWGRDCQVYVTPVSQQEICVALVSSSSKLRLEDALDEFPELSARLANAQHASNERGAVTVTRRLGRVYRHRIVLVGDASGGVDAITGEGLCLGFRQAALLGDCLASGDLARYQTEHRRLIRRPALMAHMMLIMARHHRLRMRAMRVFNSHPSSFAGMLAMHVGARSTRDYLSQGMTLGWQLLWA